MDRAEFVTSLQLANVPREIAEREADKRYASVPTAADLAKQQRDANVREKEEQHEITKRFRVCGFTVRNLSQARPSKIAVGVADLFLTHTTRPVALFWESKRQVGGTYSEAQLEFRRDCERCHVVCLGGDRYDCERYLVTNDFARVDRDGQITPMRER